MKEKMKEKLIQLKNLFLEKLETVENQEQLKELEVEFLGKK
jgi:hypothetical protein